MTDRVLLDTHVWLWMQTDPDRLAPAARRLVEDPHAELLLSAASAWEIAIKYQRGKLPLPEPPRAYVPDRIRRSGTSTLAVTHAHALHTASLPDHHRDPFDRLIIAQAQIIDIPIITADQTFEQYEVAIIPT